MTCSLADHTYTHMYILIPHDVYIKICTHMFHVLINFTGKFFYSGSLSLSHTHTRTLLQIGCVNYNCCLLVNLV